MPMITINKPLKEIILERDQLIEKVKQHKERVLRLEKEIIELRKRLQLQQSVTAILESERLSTS